MAQTPPARNRIQQRALRLTFLLLLVIGSLALLGSCDSWRFHPYDYDKNEGAKLEKKKGGYSIGLEERDLLLKKKIPTPLLEKKREKMLP